MRMNEYAKSHFSLAHGINIPKQNAYFINKFICHSPIVVGVQRQHIGL